MLFKASTLLLCASTAALPITNTADVTCAGTMCGCSCISMGNDFCYPQSVLDQTVAQLGGCDVLMNRIGNQCSNAPALALALGLRLGVCTEADRPAALALAAEPIASAPAVDTPSESMKVMDAKPSVAQAKISDVTCAGTMCGCSCISMGNDFCYPQSALDQTVAQLGGCDVLMNRIGNQCSNAPAFALALGLKINLGVCTPQ